MIYVSSACIKNQKIRETVIDLANKGIRSIELSGGTVYYQELESDLNSLKEMYDLKYVCHAYFPPPKEDFVVNLASCNDKIYKRSIRHYEECIEFMKRIQCKVLSIHAGFLVEINADEIGKKINTRIVYREQEAYDRFCNAYRHIENICKKNGIEFYLENNVLSDENYKSFGMNNYMMMTDYDSIMKMKKQMEFNLLLDLGHLHVSTRSLGLNFSEQCKKLKEHVKWLHLSQNNGIVDEHKPLIKDSEILIEYEKMKHEDINITLETVGSIDEIIESMNLLKKD